MSEKRERESEIISVSKELEALQREHQTVEPTETGTEIVEAKLREENVQAVYHTMSILKNGQDEATFLTMMANYISSLEVDKMNLNTQVQRLSVKNNWLLKSMTESQQLLQEAELTLIKTTTDKQHCETAHALCQIPMNLSSFMDIDTQEEEKIEIQDEIPMGFTRDNSMSIHQDRNSLEETSFECEIPEKIKTLHKLTLKYISQGKPEVAIPLCCNAIQELERERGRNNPDLASLLNILAIIYREQGRFEESIGIFQETLEIRETVLGLKHPDVASTLNNLSVLHGKCGDFKTAEPLCQRALEIRKELLGLDHPNVAKQLCNLAILCSNLGRLDEVEQYYQRAMEIFEMELGPDDPNVSKTMNNLANCYLKKGENEAAERMYKKLMTKVANSTSALEADNMKLKAHVKHLCSENSWLQKSTIESQQLFQEADITLMKMTTDKQHCEFVHSQYNIEKFQMDSNSFMDIHIPIEERIEIKDVIPMCFPHDTSMNIHQTSFDQEIPQKIRTIHQFTLQCINQGKPEVAIPLCCKAIHELERITGRNDPDLASLLNILAIIYREQGRFEESIRILQETLEIRETVLGLKHPVVASTLNNLSVLHGKCGNFKTAEPLCQRALWIRKELLGPDHPDVAKQLCNLAILCSHLGKFEEVEHYYQRAVVIFETELGPDDPNVSRTMNNLANCYLKQRKYKAAERMCKKVLISTRIEERPGEKQNHGRGEGGRGRGEDSGFDRGAPPQLGAPDQWHKFSPLLCPTLSETLRCLTDSYRGQGKLEDAAELEKLMVGKMSDKTRRDHILRKFRDGSTLVNKIEPKISSISSKKQGFQRKEESKSSLNWGRVFGSRDT